MAVTRTLRAVALLVFVLHWPLVSSASDAYRLKPGDVVEITVLEDPGLDRQALVRPDGMISLPLAGTVEASGQTVEQVQAAVRARIRSAFVTPPTVTASLIAVAPEVVEPEDMEALPSFYVLGEVQRPGVYEFEADKPVTILQALAIAGGPSTFAARSRIQVRQLEAGVEQILIFDYDAIADQEAQALPVTLSDGGVILVPERGLFD
ncbi:MAG: hypothetical protein Kilf2KO_06410 [Rhodospirillales bacterium]